MARHTSSASNHYGAMDLGLLALGNREEIDEVRTKKVGSEKGCRRTEVNSRSVP
jgi:hypothetical protein